MNVSQRKEDKLISYDFNLSKEMILNEKGFSYLHRDISWLSFNYRVLQEAMDPTVPLFERIKFLSIYSSNLDEFFRVRMANHRNLLRAKNKVERELEFSAEATIREVQRIVNEQQIIFNKVFEDQIIPELKEHKIHFNRWVHLNETQQEFVSNYFQNRMLPYVQPVFLVKNKVRPFLSNASLYLSILLKDKENEKLPIQYAIVKIPSDELPRFIPLPSKGGRHDLIMLDDIVRYNLTWMFPGYEILDSFSVKLTRDAELYLDDEFSGDLIQKIKRSLAKRHVGPASRFVYDRNMPEELLNYLKEALGLDEYDILQEGRYHNNFDFVKFPNFGKDELKHRPWEHLSYKPLEDAPDIFKAIQVRDHLLHFPFHNYESIIRFFQVASGDPLVTHIKIIQYRVAQNSKIMEALKRAVRKGKQVSVFIEVKARFDEQANLEWGEHLKAHGVNVRYSFPGVKVHSKLALIRRQEILGPKMYAYLSTGNFHEETVKIYSDDSLFTADERIVNEVARVFSFLETVNLPRQTFQHLLVGQFNLRPKLEQLIDFEIEQAKMGRTAQIILKLNSLQDKKMIERLYQASNAGVDIRLIIRGICSLIPGIKGMSENIEAISIVDRFLEHSRVFYFHHAGKENIYLSSADWMVRNLNFRVETAFPIYDPRLKKEIKDILNIQLSDNVKARYIDKSLSNTFVEGGSDIAIQSQMETYYYLKRKG